MTNYEREMQAAGFSIINFTHEEIMEHLLDIFKRDESELLSIAASDTTKMRELCIILDYSNLGDMSTIFGGTIHYNKKLRKFTHITYSDNRNYAVQFSIESKCAYFSHEFWKPLRKVQPFWTIKKLGKYLLEN